MELVAEQQERFRGAYQLARDHLKVVAQRRKSYYNVGVKSAELLSTVCVVLLSEKVLQKVQVMAIRLYGAIHGGLPFDGRDILNQKGPHDKTTVVHVDKLKLCVEVPTCNKVTVNAVVVSASSMEQLPIRNKCDRCDKIFTRPVGLRQHRESVHLKVTWPCQLCQEEQSSESNPTRHYKRRHPDIREIPEPRRGVREERKTRSDVASDEEEDRVAVSVRQVTAVSSAGARDNG